MNATCIVVEDSRLARNELVALIEEIGGFGRILSASHGEEAIEVINAEKPSVIFLDIHLPGMNGFEVLEILDHVPDVIFTTAFDEYAIKSFEYNAIDYLLKPIKKERLEKAINKLHPQEKGVKNKSKNLEQVFVRDGDKCWFVKLRDIRVIESVGNYSRLFFNGEKPMIQKSLNYLEGVLDKDVFFRINRQQIVNLQHVDKMETWFNGKIRLKMRGGEELEVSRRRSQELKRIFSF